MLNTVRKTIKEYSLIRPGDHITVALSGGKDSMALASVLLLLDKEFGFTLSALHIHHGLRQASDTEMAFVEQWCQKNRLPLETRCLHLGSASEEQAREARYRVFAEYTAEGKKIATAHHLGDQTETFLINLSRGCGITGLCAIPICRDGIIRPMLSVLPQQIEHFVSQRDIPFVTDESNFDTKYLRNCLRQQVLPPLTQRTDVDFYHGFAATLQNLQEEQAALTDIARHYYEEHTVSALQTLPSAVLWRVLKHQCPDLTRERFSVIRKRLLPDSVFKEQIKGNLFAVSENGLLCFRDLSPISPQPLTNGMHFANKTIFLQEIHSPFTHFDIDCDTIKSDLIIRPKQNGDCFYEATTGRKKSIKKMFSDRHITDRERRFVLTDTEGNIVYVEKIGAAKGFATSADTKKAIRIIIKNKEN